MATALAFFQRAEAEAASDEGARQDAATSPGGSGAQRHGRESLDTCVSKQHLTNKRSSGVLLGSYLYVGGFHPLKVRS